MHSAEAVSQPGVTPEDIALTASRALLSEVRRGGCVDRQHQVLVLLMMALGSEDVGRCKLGEPTTRTYGFEFDFHLVADIKFPEYNSCAMFISVLAPHLKSLPPSLPTLLPLSYSFLATEQAISTSTVPLHDHGYTRLQFHP